MYVKCDSPFFEQSPFFSPKDILIFFSMSWNAGATGMAFLLVTPGRPCVLALQ